MSKAAFSLLDKGIQEAVWDLGWKEFKPIQVQAIHTICESHDHVLICAPTAGGKTEAAFLPIISQLAASPQPSVQAIYVGPLKALINDQFRRLEELCRKLDIKVHRWHGDVSANHKKAFRDSPSGILLITPESLESNFINYGVHVPRIYRHVTFVVIDELHSFLGNVRGVHLQSLLNRLTSATGGSPRLIGLSATLADPQTARFFLAPDMPENVRVIDDPHSNRQVRLGIKAFLKKPHEHGGSVQWLAPEAAVRFADHAASGLIRGDLTLPANAEALPSTKRTFIPDVEDELDEIAQDIVNNFRLSTNLIFGNSKQSIEVLADRLHQEVRRKRWPEDPFVVHHGSVSKDIRDEAEASLKSGVPTTALCSSTLEMGIDIGHVRAVGQLDTPWSVASTVQRLGRSGRREGEAAVMRMYIRDECPNNQSTLTDLLYPELLRAIAITRLMVSKWLEPPIQGQLNLSTLTHQILSCLKQSGGDSAANLYATLCKKGPFRAVGSPQFAILLRGLAAHKLVEQTPDALLILGLNGERLAASFDFYAAFWAAEEFAVRSGSEEIGKLPANIIPPVGDHLILAGKRWRVEEILESQRTVFVVLSPGGKAPVFRGATGDVETRIVLEMKSILLDDNQPAYIDENGQSLLQAARRIFRAVKLDQENLIVGRETIQWYPWVGTRTLLTLSLLAKLRGIDHELDRLSIIYHLSDKRGFLKQLQEVASSPPDAVVLARLLPTRTFEKYDEYLPEGLLDEANAKTRIDLREALTACQSLLKANQ
jgi:ATP-dependent Lhr-like helicase